MESDGIKERKLPKYTVAINLNTDDQDELKTFLKSIFPKQPEDKQICPICKKKLASEANRDRHVARVHDKNGSDGNNPPNKNRQKPAKQVNRPTKRGNMTGEVSNMLINDVPAKEPNSKQLERSARTVLMELESESDDGLGTDTEDIMELGTASKNLPSTRKDLSPTSKSLSFSLPVERIKGRLNVHDIQFPGLRSDVSVSIKRGPYFTC